MKKKEILLNPGPVNVTDRVRNALLKPDLCHREGEFNKLLQDVRTKILKVYNLDEKKYVSVVITGSGTAAVESAFISLHKPASKSLIISNGVYGERISKIAKAYNMGFTELKYAWGEDINLYDIEEILKKDCSIQTVALIHHETTTGVLNDLKSIGKLAKRYNKDLFVDAVSSFGGEELDFYGWGLDICCGTSNKCLHGVPGVSFVISKRDIFERQKDVTPKSVYLDLVNYYNSEENGVPPFTPAVQALYAFDEALNEVLEEGVNSRINTYKERAEKIRTLSKDMKLRPFIPFEKMCATLTSFYLPEGLSYDNLHGKLKKEGFVIYAGQGGLSKNIFRIANLGDISLSDIDRLFTHIGEIIK